MRILIQPLFLYCLLLSLSFSAKAEQEPWYAYWAYGVSSHTHPTETQKKIDAVKAKPGASTVTGDMDLYGFYFPNKSIFSLLGVVVHIASDHVYYFENRSQPNRKSSTIYVNQLYISSSIINFFSKEIGKGFFYRADAGLGASQLLEDDEFNDTKKTRTYYGVSGLLGLGYGFPVSDDSRVLIGLNYGFVTNFEEINGTANLMLGGLW